MLKKRLKDLSELAELDQSGKIEVLSDEKTKDLLGGCNNLAHCGRFSGDCANLSRCRRFTELE
jgi:hypothetical protein